MAVPWTVCRRRQVRRCYVTCGTCLAPRPRRARAPAATPSECCRRVSCHGHAHLQAWQSTNHSLASIGYACVCSLRGICLRLSRHLAFALQRHWRQEVRRSQPRHSRLPSTRHVESDIWAASRHFHGDSWVLLRLAVLSEIRAASSSRWLVVLWLRRPIPLLEDRIRAQHMMRGCAPTRMSEAATTSLATAHMLITNNANSWANDVKEFQQIAKA